VWHKASIGGRTKVDRTDRDLFGTRPELSEAEHEAVVRALWGWSNRKIARHFCVSVSAIEQRFTKAYAKLGVKGRSELAGVYRGKY
jgi:DNA-binding NarL/FixJ family response regulator